MDNMECMRLFFAVILCLRSIEGRVSNEPPFDIEDYAPLLCPSLDDRTSLVTYAAVKDITIRPFRKRPPTLQYQVILDSNIFNITLRQSMGLISKGCLVHHYALNGEKNLYPCNRRKPDCYYIGKSDSHNNSWVAANTCNGLKGVLNIGNLSYFFDPMKSKNSATRDGHVHNVYRFQGVKQMCAVNDYSRAEILHSNRVRRDVTDPSATKFIETRVVIEPHMVLRYGRVDTVEQYVYMAFNIAYTLFKDPSLRQDVHLMISEVHIIEEFTDFASNLTGNAFRSLDLFCKWQDQLKTEVDANVLMTRLNLYDEGSDHVTGLGYPYGMCRRRQNCVIVEDQGPTVGVTVAHELGHLLGMEHDLVSEGVGIMSPGGWSGKEAFEWTKKSALAFYKFATSASDPLKCLSNIPNGRWSRKGPLPPGLMISADDQCKLMFDPTAYFVPYNHGDPCTHTSCSSPSSPLTIFAGGAPFIDGTDCYNNRSWCNSGQCVPIGVKYSWLAAIDGAWSEWSTYTECSRTCNGGVQTRNRLCNNPLPQFGGKTCAGVSTNAKLCNLETCGPLESDDKKRQCEMKADSTSACTQSYGGTPCQFQICPANVSKLCTKHWYESGTACLQLTSSNFAYSRCVDHKCRNFGCDGVSESSMNYDNCGVCNGTGSTCDMHTGVYNKDGVYKVYVDVITIPKSSSGIRVYQNNRFCFLSILVNGTRILNANGTKGYSLSNTISGIKLIYNSLPERLEILSRIPTDIVIQVYRRYSIFSANASPSVSYTYYTKKSGVPMEYAWAIIPNNTCSKECGTGTESDDIKCRNIPGDVVDDFFCGIESKPAKVFRLCNTQPCPPRWQASPWSSCLSPCGIGYKTRNVSCVVEVNSRTEVVDEALCQNLTHPTFQSACLHVSNCVGDWVIGNWSKCSRSCGNGYRSRNISCQSTQGQITSVLKNEDCDMNLLPESLEKCNHGPCYVVSQPGMCSDSSPKCAEYYNIDELMCSTKSNWMEKCKLTCGVCNCDKHTANDCRLVTKVMMTWMFQNCPVKCGVCNGESSCYDIDKCRMIDVRYCEDKDYIRWMYRYCPQMCGVCRDCTDCAKHNLDSCSRDRIDFYKSYCSKSCNFC